MNAMDHHEVWALKPRKLSLEEYETPEKVIDQFFNIAQLPQARWHLWEMMKTLVTGDFATMRSSDRSSLLFFYEQIEKLVEAAHVIYQKRNAAKA
jgi:hypothetical protein